MATLQDLRSKIKTVSPEAREKLFYTAVIVLVALLAFGIGRLSVIYGGGGDIKVEYPL